MEFAYFSLNSPEYHEMTMVLVYRLTLLISVHRLNIKRSINISSEGQGIFIVIVIFYLALISTSIMSALMHKSTADISEQHVGLPLGDSQVSQKGSVKNYSPYLTKLWQRKKRDWPKYDYDLCKKENLWRNLKLNVWRGWKLLTVVLSKTCLKKTGWFSDARTSPLWNTWNV